MILAIAFFNKHYLQFFFKIVLPGLLVWINKFEVSFGAATEVLHMFMYAHRFTIFIPGSATMIQILKI